MCAAGFDKCIQQFCPHPLSPLIRRHTNIGQFDHAAFYLSLAGREKLQVMAPQRTTRLRPWIFMGDAPYLRCLACLVDA